VTGCLALQNFCSAYNNVIIDATLISMARKDEKNGSADLQSFAWSFIALGGVLSATIASFTTESENPQ